MDQKTDRQLTLLLLVTYVAVSVFLCLAAVENPHLTDYEQYIWCAVAVAWGPALLLVLWLIFFF